ncbi:hypothetical protein BS78_02G130000 [Paspalum vaginatum]|nr:hypothetical protein BS78_02G130000 [Paspalum vaginatum]
MPLQVGASGGILVGWNGSLLHGQIIHNTSFAVTIKFSSTHNAECWSLTAVYGPCQGPQRDEFVNWLNALHIEEEENWMFIGDFNFYRSVEDRNRPGCHKQPGLLEIPLKGRRFTWSNMQDDPLLEQLDWCFTSTNWTEDYLNTLMLPLAKPISDHIPLTVQIGTKIPKSQIFRFENYWTEHPDFLEIVESTWNTTVRANNSASKIMAKFKLLRRVLKKWSKSISRLNNLLKECNETYLG